LNSQGGGKKRGRKIEYINLFSTSMNLTQKKKKNRSVCNGNILTKKRKRRLVLPETATKRKGGKEDDTAVRTPPRNQTTPE